MITAKWSHPMNQLNLSLPKDMMANAISAFTNAMADTNSIEWTAESDNALDDEIETGLHVAISIDVMG